MNRAQFVLKPLSAAVLSSLVPMVVIAEDQINTLNMPPIVVTAQHASQAGGLIVIADPKQPIQPVPATDGADYLRSIMGFNAVKNGGTNGDVTFRGMFGSRIKILTDGSENLGACPSRMDAPTSYINPQSYDRITVIKGPQTVKYANTGSAATVIFERQRPSLSSDQPYQGQASVLLGSFGRIDHNIEAVFGDERAYTRINANRSESNSYKDGDNNTVPSSWERWNADLALGWTPDENTWLELKAGRGDAEAMYAGRSMDGSQFARESLGLHLEKRNLTEHITKLEGQVDYSYNSHIMDNYTLRTPPMMHDMKTHKMVSNPSSMRVTRRTLNARMVMDTQWQDFNLSSGIDMQQNHHGGDMRSNTMYMPMRTDMKFNSYGVFSELNYKLTDQQHLVTGVRLDQVKIDALNLNDDRKETLPSAFIRVENQHPQQNANSYFGLGYVERVPDYWELFSTKHGNSGLDTPSFNDLKTEKTLQLDLGYAKQYGDLNVWSSAYAGLVDDFILMRYQNYPASGGHGHGTRLSAAAKNVDATIAGAEAGVGYQLTDRIQSDLSAMYAWGENRSDNKPLPQIAPLEARLNLRYITDQYSLGVLWRVVAKQNRYSLNEGNIAGYDVGSGKAFNTLSLNASYRVLDSVDFAVGIDNVLDKTYAEHLNKLGSAGFGYAANEQFNNIGRNYWASVSMKF